MIDILKLNDEISDEMLAAYIDGNTTMEENALIEDALSLDELLLETQEVVSDIHSFMTDHDWNSLEKATFSIENPIDCSHDNIMVAALSEQPETDYENTSLDITTLDSYMTDPSSDLNWNTDDYEL